MHQREKYFKGARGIFCYGKTFLVKWNFLKRKTSKCFKFPDSNKGSTIQNILMKQKKTLHQCGGNFLHSEAKVLQGDKVMFDQQILMNNDKKGITNQ